MNTWKESLILINANKGRNEKKNIFIRTGSIDLPSIPTPIANDIIQTCMKSIEIKTYMLIDTLYDLFNLITHFVFADFVKNNAINRSPMLAILIVVSIDGIPAIGVLNIYINSSMVRRKNFMD